MVPLISFAVFVFVLATVGYFGYRTYSRSANLLEKLNAPPAGLRDVAPGGYEDGVAQAPSFRVRKILLWLGEKVPVSPEEAGVTSRMLLSAGYKSSNALFTFMALRVVCACTCLALAAALTTSTSWIPLADAAILIVSVGFGY